MPKTNFERWFADLLGHSEFEVKRLLSDSSALHFLIAWSIFEAKCFGGYLKEKNLEKFTKRLAPGERFDVQKIEHASEHFHARYQDTTRLRHLTHEKPSAKINVVLAKPFRDLTAQETIYLAVFVVYRFRNNIFHGNKGVGSWLSYKEQIDLCTIIMQAFVSHAEALQCSIKIEQTA